MQMRYLTAALMALMLGGCNALGALGNPQGITWFTLEARSPRTAPPPASTGDRSVMPLTLLVALADSNPFYNSTQIAYSRSDIARAYYQFAAWTERPAKSITTLVSKKLQHQGQFAQVARQTAGILGNLELNLSLVELYHDAASVPQQGRIRIDVELVDIQLKRLVARQSFSAASEVQVSDAANAVRAISLATDRVLSELTDWVNTQARSTLVPPAPGKSINPKQ
jgi:cholesterol transport system auxiliary component